MAKKSKASAAGGRQGAAARPLASRWWPLLRGPTAALLTGAMLFFSFPPYDLEPLAWVALVPLLLWLRVAGWKEALLWSAALGIGLKLLLVSWLRHVTVAGWLTLTAYIGLYPAAFSLLVRYCRRRLGWPMAFIAPPIWTALELARGTLFMGFAWFLLGHTQYLNLPFIQAADTISAYGLSFVLVMFNAALADLIALRRRAILPAAAAAAVVALTFGYGWLRLASYRPAEGPRICLVQGNVPIGLKHSSDEKEVEAFVRNHVRLSLTPEGREADLIVWPETMVPVYLNLAAVESDNEYIRFAKRLYELVMEVPRETHRHLLAGSLTFGGSEGPFYNSAYYFSPEGRHLGTYHKIHLVTFGEYTPLKRYFPFLAKLRPAVMGHDLTPGNDYVVFTLPWQGKELRFAATICYEDTVPYVPRTFARSGIDFLVNISNDGWFLGSPEMDQHMAVCVFRAVETRLPIARASNTGISSFIEPTGRIQAYLHKDGDRREIEGVLSGALRMSNLSSPYVHLGEAFPLACAGAAALIWAMAFLKKRRRGG